VFFFGFGSALVLILVLSWCQFGSTLVFYLALALLDANLALPWCILLWLCLDAYFALALPWCQPGSVLVLIWLCLGCLFGFDSASMLIWLCRGAYLALARPWCLFYFGFALMLIWL
jgi:hypothetical protein